MNQMHLTDNHTCLISQIYKAYYHSVHRYIINRTNNHYLAEDMTQDVFIRLLDVEAMLRLDTINSLIFTVARNIVIDFLRRKIKHPECSIDLIEHQHVISTEWADNQILVREIMLLEKSGLKFLPPNRKKVYCMSRYNEMSVSGISKEMSITYRTAESHLFTARKKMRTYIAKCL